MKIWKLGVHFGDFGTYMLVDRDRKKCEELSLHVDFGKRTNTVFDGEKIAVYEGDEKADFSHVWDISNQVLTEKAKNILSDILENNVELIVMQTEEEGENVYLLNVLNILDALNYELTEIDYGPSGFAIRVEKYAFKPELIGENDIFKIYLEDRVYLGGIFVSDKFKKIVEENNLTGFKFTEVWEG